MSETPSGPVDLAEAKSPPGTELVRPKDPPIITVPTGKARVRHRTLAACAFPRPRRARRFTRPRGRFSRSPRQPRPMWESLLEPGRLALVGASQRLLQGFL